MHQRFFFIIFLFFSLSISSSILKNNYEIRPGEVTSSEVNRAEFYNITSEIYELFYRPNISLKYEWDQPYFTAYAHEESEESFSLNFWGGLARIPDMLEETWAFVVCHELGHVLGGGPFLNIDSLNWASSEGQSDYFAAQICLPRYFKSKGQEDIKYQTFLPFELGFCTERYKKQVDHSVCLRLLRAQRGFVAINRYMQNDEAYEFNKQIQRTNNEGSMPSLQCRMNTLTDGTSCIHKICARNKCWY
jgi:hypothetical protein